MTISACPDFSSFLLQDTDIGHRRGWRRTAAECAVEAVSQAPLGGQSQMVGDVGHLRVMMLPATAELTQQLHDSCATPSG